MNDGLPDSYRQSIMEVFELIPEVARARVFGSRSFGRYHKASDLDLALESADGEPISRDRLRLLRSMIEGLNLPIDVDLVDIHALKDAQFRAVIERDGKLWWSRCASSAREEKRATAAG